MNAENKELAPEAVEAAEKLGEYIEELIAKVREREKACLLSVFTRFCIQQGVVADISDVDALPNGKNGNSYYYKLGTRDQFFLMSAKFFFEDRQPKLQVDYHPSLAFNNEL